MEEIEENKNLIIRLLNNDIMAYKFYIDEIRKMGKDDFEQFFKGNRNHKFKVKRESTFQLLVEKVQNYQLFFNWGTDEKRYPYLEEIWKNYFCVQDLKGKNNDEEISKLLKSCNINYSEWPEDIKIDFRGCINANNDTFIYRCKEMYKQLKEIPKYLLGKLKDIIDYLESMGFEKLKNLAEEFNLDVIKQYLGYLGMGSGLGFMGLNIIGYIRKNVIKGTGEKKLFSQETLLHLMKNKNELITSKFFLFSETLYSLGNLTNAIQDYFEIKNIGKQIEGFDKQFGNITDNFKNHITNFKYGDVLEKGQNIKYIFDKILEDINNDLKDLEKLIDNINSSIEKYEGQKTKSKIGIVSSGIGAVGGLGMAILTGGASIPITLTHLFNSLINGASVALNIKNLLDFSKIIKELKSFIEKIKEERCKMRTIIEGLQAEQKIMMESPINLFPKYFS